MDAVIITSPTFTHEKLICESLKSRKEIFCEKPLTSSYEKSLKCYEAAKAAGRTLFCAFNRRFDPSYAAARERVTKGEIGHIQLIKLVTRGSPLASLDYIKNSGGIYHDLVSHVIDLMIWFVGEFPTRVSSRSFSLKLYMISKIIFKRHVPDSDLDNRISGNVVWQFLSFFIPPL